MLSLLGAVSPTVDVIAGAEVVRLDPAFYLDRCVQACVLGHEWHEFSKKGNAPVMCR